MQVIADRGVTTLIGKDKDSRTTLYNAFAAPPMPKEGKAQPHKDWVLRRSTREYVNAFMRVWFATPANLENSQNPIYDAVIAFNESQTRR